MKVLVTGANGFIGKNLVLHLDKIEDIELLTYLRSDPVEQLYEKTMMADFVFHLAGINRPENDIEFSEGNVELTGELCNAIRASERTIPVLYTSTIQAKLDNPYGKSKKQAEELLCKLSEEIANPVYIYRLPNVFGKWCRPNYNSVVATFCYNILNDIPIQINDPEAELQLVYIDDVVSEFQSILQEDKNGVTNGFVPVTYSTTVGKLAEQLYRFRDSRDTLIMDDVGHGLTRALYSTYVSYMNPRQFSYSLEKHEDERGSFVEILKTRDSGQISYFTAAPGVTRGSHYHHSKTEKFLVLNGKARFKFRHMDSGEEYTLDTAGEECRIVETVPGWAHDITNVGTDVMFVLLWANENFNHDLPDTISERL